MDRDYVIVNGKGQFLTPAGRWHDEYPEAEVFTEAGYWEAVRAADDARGETPYDNGPVSILANYGCDDERDATPR